MAVVQATKAEEATAQAFSEFAYHFGLAFQIQDDYLDHFAPHQQLGKNRSSDIANQKHTYTSLYQEQELRLLIKQEFNKARAALTLLAGKAELLCLFCNEIEKRNNVRD